ARRRYRARVRRHRNRCDRRAGVERLAVGGPSGAGRTDAGGAPMKVEKWHGAGNDFLVIDGRALATPPDWPSWTAWACDRRRGVGADGLLILEPDPELDFRMHYRNADGGEAEMCGNGGRILDALAVTWG